MPNGKWTALVVLLLFCTSAGAQQMGKQPHLFWVYIGNQTRNGIGLFKLDTEAGKLTAEGIAAPANITSFIGLSPDQKYLYSSINLSETARVSGVQGFSIDAKTGKLSPINNQPTGGEDATFVSVDPSGKTVLVAHYSMGTVVALPRAADGKLSPFTTNIKQIGSSVHPERQTHAYAHAINTDLSGKFAIVCDLGCDKLFVYKLDPEAGKLTPNDPPAAVTAPGSGPRHLTFHPNNKWAYVITEMGGTVISYTWDAGRGVLNEFQTISTLPEDFKGTNTSAEVQIDPSGRFLYASNRGDTNFLTIYTIDQQTGKLTLVDRQDSAGKTPRNFRIDPTGKFMIVANQTSGNLVLFKIDQATGKLTQMGTPLEITNPTCVKFVAVQEQ